MSENDAPRGEPAVKAKLPDPKTIARTDFTPHGISAGRGRAPKLNAKTAAEAKKRRQFMIIALAAAVLVIGAGITYVATRPEPQITVSGAFGKDMKVGIPKDYKPDGKLQIKTLHAGTGAPVAKDDIPYVTMAVYRVKGAPSATQSDSADSGTDKKDSGKKSEPIQEYKARQLEVMPIGNTGLKGLDKALVGKKTGSRLLVIVPPSEGLGKEGNPQAGISGTDTLVFGIDIMTDSATAQGTDVPQTDKKLPNVPPVKHAEVPKVTIPKNDPPSTMVSKTLVQGTGPAVAKGDEVIANYTGLTWKGAKQFDSSWENRKPGLFEIGVGKVVPGWDKALVGQKIGSRLLLVLPPADGYGDKGNPAAGISGTDTLVFQIDILGTMPK